MTAQQGWCYLAQPWGSPHFLAKGKDPGAQIGDVLSNKEPNLSPKRSGPLSPLDGALGGRS